jgi:hypothetical protein
MKKYFFIIFLFSLEISAQTDNSLKNDTLAVGRYIEYLAGIEILIADHRLNPEQKAANYMRLCRYTGVDGQSVQSFIHKYDSLPDQWQKIQDAVLEKLDGIKQ